MALPRGRRLCAVVPFDGHKFIVSVSPLLQELLQITCRDFEWLYYKCKSNSLTDVLMDLDYALSCLNSKVKSNEDQLSLELTEANAPIDGLDQDSGLESSGNEALDGYVHEIEQLKAMLIMGSDGIRRDPSNLALQVSYMYSVIINLQNEIHFFSLSFVHEYPQRYS